MVIKLSGLTPNVEKLLARGVVSVGTYSTNEGIDCWVRLLNPQPGLGIGTSQSLTMSEAEEALKTLVEPLRVTMTLGASGGVSLKREVPARGVTDMTFQEARIAAPTEVKFADGHSTKLPLDSLTNHDLNFAPRKLLARAFLVSDKLRTPKLIARIRGNPDLHVAGVTNLGDWWKYATGDQRFVLLSTASKRGKFTGGSTDSLANLQCPFLDAEGELSEEGSHALEDEESSS
jgi:hypothetical protein